MDLFMTECRHTEYLPNAIHFSNLTSTISELRFHCSMTFEGDASIQDMQRIFFSKYKTISSR